MKVSTAFRNAWKAYTASFGQTLIFFLVEACLTLICLAPLLGLAGKAPAWIAWACPVLWIFVMLPARMTAAEGRLDLSFTPEIDRCDYLDFKVIISDQHQVFGTFSGTVRLDDGTLFEIEGLRGFAEAVHNMY